MGIDLQRGILRLRQENGDLRIFECEAEQVFVPLSGIGGADHEGPVLYLCRVLHFFGLCADDLTLLFIGGRDRDIRDVRIDGDLIEGAADLMGHGFIFLFTEVAVRGGRADDQDRSQHHEDTGDYQPYFSCSAHFCHPFLTIMI